MMHSNISIFVPHLGCPNNCSFCDQRCITGKVSEPSAEDICSAVETACNSKGFNAQNTEIAFFGGSFTAIKPEYMLFLLKTASELIDQKGLKGIRVSTRPDAINDDNLNILKKYNVTSIELGAQSMDDRVLLLNDRGHLSNDVESSSKLIKSYGFELGLQMMTGLYGDNECGALKTAEKIIELKPDTVRIYPTIVLKNTKLAQLYKMGAYFPQELDSAVKLSAELINMFENAKIRVIRTGLHTINLSDYIAGPWHPAFSELCQSELIYKKIVKDCEKSKSYDIHINPADISKAVGQKKSNLNRLLSNGYKINFIQDSDINKNSMKIKEVN